MNRMCVRAAAVIGVGACVAMVATGQPQDAKPAAPAAPVPATPAAGAPSAAPAAQPPSTPPATEDKPGADKPGTEKAPPPPATRRSASAAFDPAVIAEFKAQEGTWDLDVTFRFQPGAEPVKCAAVMSSKVIMDGMFLEQVMDGTFGPAQGNKAWSSRSIYGYNPAQGSLQVVRMSNFNSVMIPERGAYHAGDAKFEVSGQYQLAGMTCSQRDVTTVEGPDKRRVESYMAFGNMPEFKGFEMVATRRK